MVMSDATVPGWTVSQAKAAGKSHLAVNCDTCRKLVLIPWPLVAALQPSDTSTSLAARLRCSQCGERPQPHQIDTRTQSDFPGYASR